MRKYTHKTSRIEVEAMKWPVPGQTQQAHEVSSWLVENDIQVDWDLDRRDWIALWKREEGGGLLAQPGEWIVLEGPGVVRVFPAVFFETHYAPATMTRIGESDLATLESLLQKALAIVEDGRQE